MEIYLYFLIGLGLLVKGADIFVDGAASLAWKLGVSRLVIGLTVVSFGTSAPELVVNVIAAMKGSSDIAVGNIIGSNNANLMLILGVSAMLFPVHVSQSTVWRETPYSLLAILLLFIMTNDNLINPSYSSDITRSDGIILLFFFSLFIYYVFNMSNESEESDTHIKQISAFRSLLYIFIGLVGLTLGGKWLVDSAVEMARIFGLSEAVIGLTVVAIGTSLPELATSITAAYKKHSDIVIGNIIGSNIFNVLWILGITSTIQPLAYNPKINFDVAVCAMATVLLFVFFSTGKKYCMEKWEGGVYLLAYCIYLTILFWGV